MNNTQANQACASHASATTRPRSRSLPPPVMDHDGMEPRFRRSSAPGCLCADAKTSCKTAIDNFEASPTLNPDGQLASAAKVVKLHGMWPPIKEMDASLHELGACEHLHLSSNAIHEIGDLTPLPQLKILSLGRNNLRHLGNLDLRNLQELSVPNNMIVSLEGAKHLPSLIVLDLSKNRIDDFDQVKHLCALPCLRELNLSENPLQARVVSEHGQLAWAGSVLKLLPQLEKLDGKSVSAWKTLLSYTNAKLLRDVLTMIEAEGGTTSPRSLRRSVREPAIRASLLDVPRILAKSGSPRSSQDLQGDVQLSSDASRNHLVKTFELIDRNKNGKLEPRELRAAVDDPHICNTVMAELRQFCHVDLQRESLRGELLKLEHKDEVPFQTPASSCCIIC
eukprot:TRINITY_DN2014_c0_g1_i7.p1 TRINITY_DN2014_c0_g1~~TRINITY_DN2014_c0_g1_i7.p1  ORF type:complete len:394 (-),score=96.53 TRINITY_DN2014_c0_g1_i7:437-1618(-)